MDMPEKNTVRELPQTFNAGKAIVPLHRSGGRHYRAKVFKSGNSLALRLPKALGLEAGMEMELEVAADGSCSFKPADQPKRKFDIDKVAGSARTLKYVEPKSRLFESRPSASDSVE